MSANEKSGSMAKCGVAESMWLNVSAQRLNRGQWRLAGVAAVAWLASGWRR